MKKLFEWIIFWLYFMGLYCERPPSMRLKSMELELQWKDLKNGHAIIEIEIDGDMNPSILLDRKKTVVFIFNHTSNDVIITGFVEDEVSRAPASNKPAPTIASQLSTPITKPTVAFPKKSPVVSNNFMNAFSAGTSVNDMEFFEVKKPPLVIDLPLSTPLDPVVITPTITTESVAGTVPPPDPLGPDPTQVPASSAHPIIYFADDKGEALVHTKFIENALNNKAHRPNSDMKHADAEAERISLKQMKTDADEDDDMRMEMPEMGNTEVDSSWRLIPYYMNAQNQFSQHLIDEEEARHGNVMRTFVAHSDVPIEHPSEPDDAENAITKLEEPETIPIDFAMEETVEQEPRELLAPASPDTLSANISTVSPVPVPNFARAYPIQGSTKFRHYEVITNEADDELLRMECVILIKSLLQPFRMSMCYP